MFTRIFCLFLFVLILGAAEASLPYPIKQNFLVLNPPITKIFFLNEGFFSAQNWLESGKAEGAEIPLLHQLVASVVLGPDSTKLQKMGQLVGKPLFFEEERPEEMAAWWGAFLYRERRLAGARSAFSAIDNHLWLGKIALIEGNSAKAQAHLRHFLQKNPRSPLAPEASFLLFKQQDYLRGERSAIKHLTRFTTTYSTSPLAVYAHTLLGLDFYRKEQLLEAAAHFSAAENLPTNPETGPIQKRARLERGRAYAKIAHESKGAKKEIYLAYAKEAFTPLVPDPAAVLALTKIHIASGECDLAEKLIAQPTDDPYMASQHRFIRARLAEKRQQYREALLLLQEGSLSPHLSTEEQLCWRLAESRCLKAVGDLDGAMRLLSQIINSPTISSLRIDAMLERAAIYALQGRDELAKRQRDSAHKLRKM